MHFPPPCACHIPCQSQHTLFFIGIIFWCKAHITKILISKSSPASCHSSLLSLQPPVTPASCHSTIPTTQYVSLSDITKILISKSSPASCHSTIPTTQYVSLSDISTLWSGLHIKDQVLHPYKTTKHALFCTFYSL